MVHIKRDGINNMPLYMRRSVAKTSLANLPEKVKMTP